MKRTIYTLALCALAASCEVAAPYGSVVDSNKLCEYSDAKFLEAVVGPSEILELCLDFDDYMSLTEDEQMDDYRFFGNVACLGEDLYSIRGEFTGDVSITVNTKGKSLHDVGVEWVLDSVSVGAVNLLAGHVKYADASLPEGAVVRCESDSKWRISYKEELDCMMTLVAYEESLYEWRVDAAGTETASDGLTAQFDTTDDGVVIRERWSYGEEGKHKENIFSGAFQTNVFKDGENVHRCRMTFRPGFITMYTTNIR